VLSGPWGRSRRSFEVRRFASTREIQLKDLDESLLLVYKNLKPGTALAAVLHYFARCSGPRGVRHLPGARRPRLADPGVLHGDRGHDRQHGLLCRSRHFGIMEGAHVLIVRSLGLTVALGLGVGVIRRIRKLATIAVALLVFALSREKG